jgi:hypothetical protein
VGMIQPYLLTDVAQARGPVAAARLAAGYPPRRSLLASRSRPTPRLAFLLDTPSPVQQHRQSKRFGSVPRPRLLLDPGEHDQSDERVKPGPLTIRSMREHGYLLSSEPAKRGRIARGLSREAVPATARKGCAIYVILTVFLDLTCRGIRLPDIPVSRAPRLFAVSGDPIRFGIGPDFGPFCEEPLPRLSGPGPLLCACHPRPVNGYRRSARGTPDRYSNSKSALTR